MVSRLLLCLALTSFGFEAQAQDNTGKLRLGLAYVTHSHVFMESASSRRVMPLVLYMGEFVDIIGPRFDWKLLREEAWSAGVGFNVDFSFLDRNDSQSLTSWPEIEPRINGHVFSHWDFPEAISIRASLSQDLSGESHGQTADVRIAKGIEYIGIRFMAHIGASWFDKDTFEYLFTNDGQIEGMEIGLQQTISPYAGLEMLLPVTKNFAVRADLTAYQLDSDIRRLDVIRSNKRTSFMLGVFYNMK